MHLRTTPFSLSIGIAFLCCLLHQAWLGFFSFQTVISTGVLFFLLHHFFRYIVTSHHLYWRDQQTFEKHHLSALQTSHAVLSNAYSHSLWMQEVLMSSQALGVWELLFTWDSPNESTLLWWPSMWDLCGLDRSQYPDPRLTFREFVNQDDLKRIQTIILNGIHHHAPIHGTYQMHLPQGVRRFEMQGVLFHGDPPSVIGTTRDITQEYHLAQCTLPPQRISPLSFAHPAFASCIGQSPAMQQIKTQAWHAAQSQATVLITGESGTGKEVIARLIHALSDRADQPFIAVNCGAIPETLFENEMFGHVKGAFTGATTSQPGYWRQADGGILFLDEIGELTPAQQVKLLRVLQDHTMCPVGSSYPVQVNVRILAATNIDLQTALQQHSLREDFYYRLAVLQITIPPLREHREDIPDLVHYVCQQHGYHPVPEAQLLTWLGQEWPGNVRELEFAVQNHWEMPSLPALAPTTPLTLPEQLNAYERLILQSTLQQHQGNRTATAAALGIGERTLYRKLKQYPDLDYQA